MQHISVNKIRYVLLGYFPTWDIFLMGFCPLGFCPHGIFYSGILSSWDFLLWDFFLMGFFPTWDFVLMGFYPDTTNPTLAGGLSAALSPCLSRYRQPAATLIKKGDSSMVYILRSYLTR